MGLLTGFGGIYTIVVIRDGGVFRDHRINIGTVRYHSRERKMSTVAGYVLGGISQSAAWPKKSGFLRRKLVGNSKVLDLAIE